MKFQIKPLVDLGTGFAFSELFKEVLESITGLSDSKIHAYFTDKAVGAKSKSLASTVRTLTLNDLSLRGWTINWSPFKGLDNYESAIWNFDAAKQIELDGAAGWITLEISFDNRAAVGTHLVKSRVANNQKFRKNSGRDPIFHHCIVAASQSFKTVAGLDNSVATSEEFELASEAYSLLDLTDMTLISLNALETLEVSQRKSDGRTKAKLLSLKLN